MSVQCPKCGGRVVRSREYVDGQCNFVVVDLCQLCGFRDYGDVGDIDRERWSPDFATAQPVKKSTTKREPERMGKKPKRECASCKRVMAIVARELCGGCFKKHREAGDLDERFPAKRKRVSSQPDPVSVSDIKVEPIEQEDQAGAPQLQVDEPASDEPSAGKPKADNCIGKISVNFYDGDKFLLSEIKTRAKKNRRAVQSEVLCLIESALELEGKLLGAS